jgi:hypothetical protein
MLTKENKSKRMAASIENLCHYQDWRRIICGEHRYGKWNTGLRVHIRVKRNSMTWKHPHSPTTKKIQNWTICK